MAETISSTQNPKIKEVAKLKDAKTRKEQGLILIEGAREISLALGSGVKLQTIFYCPELSNGNEELFLLVDGKIIFHTSREAFEKISYREHPDGFLAVAKPKSKKLSEIELSANPLVIVVEALEKPGNLGAILRSSDAAGADAVIVADPRADIYNPNVIRASQGTVFSNQVASATTEEVISWLKAKNIKSFAALPAADKNYTSADYTGATAIVVGTEHEGLADVWKEKADEKIKIDMKGKIDSLNVSVSLAIVLFEALRQREDK